MSCSFANTKWRHTISFYFGGRPLSGPLFIVDRRTHSGRTVANLPFDTTEGNTLLVCSKQRLVLSHSSKRIVIHARRGTTFFLKRLRNPLCALKFQPFSLWPKGICVFFHENQKWTNERKKCYWLSLWKEKYKIGTLTFSSSFLPERCFFLFFGRCLARTFVVKLHRNDDLTHKPRRAHTWLDKEWQMGRLRNS